MTRAHGRRRPSGFIYAGLFVVLECHVWVWTCVGGGAGPFVAIARSSLSKSINTHTNSWGQPKMSGSNIKSSNTVRDYRADQYDTWALCIDDVVVEKN